MYKLEFFMGSTFFLRLHISSGTTGPKEVSYVVLLYIYWIYKWYISVLPRIDQLTFSAAPPLPSDQSHVIIP